MAFDAMETSSSLLSHNMSLWLTTLVNDSHNVIDRFTLFGLEGWKRDEMTPKFHSDLCDECQGQ